LLSKVYGLDVTVLEAHYHAGGAAHAFSYGGYHFEAGPSLYNGMQSRGADANPLALVLQAIGEGDLPLIKYDEWRVHLPEGTFDTGVGADQFRSLLLKLRGEKAAEEWDALRAFMPPLAEAATALPPLALRADLGVLRTVFGRYAKRLFVGGGQGNGTSSPFSLPPIARLGALTQPFSQAVLDRVPVTDPFLRNWYDLLCFLLSGLDSTGTIAAEVAFMDYQWYGKATGGDSSSFTPALEFPVGGSGALVDALVRGLKKSGSGRLHLNAPVERVIVENGRAVGVAVKGNVEVRARKAVVSSASVWDTLPLLPKGAVPDAWRQQRQATPACPSFMHLHLGFDAEGLDPFPMHHLSVKHWDRSKGGVMAEQNVVLVSVPTVEDETLRPKATKGGTATPTPPPTKHALHAYTPATEPWVGLWDQVEPGTEAYERLKEERAVVLWEAAAKAVGAPSVDDLKRRCDVALVGTPHTHKRFLRRAYGSYGPAIRAGEGTFDFGATTPLPGLSFACDSVFPGIGLPAVAAAGAMAASSLVSVEEHERKLLEGLGI
jgi:phytoene dehydrogenase-like protein